MNEYLSKRRWIAEELTLDKLEPTAAESLRHRLWEIDNTIDGVGNELQRLVLMCKYIECLTVEQTAERLNYSPRQIRRLLKRAEDEVERLREGNLNK